MSALYACVHPITGINLPSSYHPPPQSNVLVFEARELLPKVGEEIKLLAMNLRRSCY